MTKKEEKTIELLKELIIRITGKGSESIVNILYGKKNINEFKIAEKLKITINQVRNILYKLMEVGIMDSTRKKDKKKGWYTYFWTLNVPKALNVYKNLKEQEIAVFENLLKSRELKTFYFCQLDNIEMSEETALNHNFMCPECGQLLQPVPKEKKIKEIQSRIEAVNKKIAAISEELEKFRPISKAKVKKIKKVKKVEKKKVKKLVKKAKKKR